MSVSDTHCSLKSLEASKELSYEEEQKVVPFAEWVAALVLARL